MMYLDRQLPTTLDRGGLPQSGRLFILAGASFFLIRAAWAWFHDGVLSSGNMTGCALWLIPAVVAPLRRSTIIDASAITWETVWPWGVTRREDRMERIRKVWVDRPGRGPRQRDYVVAYQDDSGRTQYLTTCDEPDEAERWVALLQHLAHIDP